MRHWIFGYGSLIWRPDINYLRRRPARVFGWQRRFWQGSHDHRGVPGRPGRVVTLVPQESAHCDGMAYEVDAEVAEDAFRLLDVREKNGYERHETLLHFANQRTAPGLVYIAPRDNHAFLGPAPLHAMAAQIRECAGPSGPNADYLFELADALRNLNVDDPHVFELETAVRREA